MNLLRKTNLSWIICLAIFGFFSLQITVSAAVNVKLLNCECVCDHESAHDSEATDSKDDCNCVCHQSVSVIDPLTLVQFNFQPLIQFKIQNLDERPSDSPVRSIDHPPQLT